MKIYEKFTNSEIHIFVVTALPFYIFEIQYGRHFVYCVFVFIYFFSLFIFLLCIVFLYNYVHDHKKITKTNPGNYHILYDR